MGDFLESFWQRVDVRGPHDCWLWTGAKVTRGYGVFGKAIAAHRFSWELHNATQVPADMFVCHRCDVPACVNPAHLWIGTPRDNTVDAMAKGRMRGSPAGAETILARRIREAATRVGGLTALRKRAGLSHGIIFKLLRPSVCGMRLDTMWKLHNAGVELPPLEEMFEVAT